MLEIATYNCPRDPFFLFLGELDDTHSLDVVHRTADYELSLEVKNLVSFPFPKRGLLYSFS